MGEEHFECGDSEVDGCVCVLAGCNNLLPFASIVEGDGSLDNNTSGKLDLTLDHELGAELQGRHAIWNNRIHSIDELVTIVQFDERWHTVALRCELNTEVFREHICIGAQRNQIVTLLDWGEARARDQKRRCSVKTRNGCSH